MELSSTIFATITFSLLIFTLFLRRRNTPNRGAHAPPPEAGGARLVTGHLHLLSGTSHTELPHFKLAKLADKYGPIFTIRVGVHRAVVVSSSEIAKEIFTACDGAVLSRPQIRSGEYLSYNFTILGFAPYGHFWRQIRKLVASDLLSPRSHELQKSVGASEVAFFINAIYKECEEKACVVDMKRRFGELNLNVILRLVAGKRFDGRDTAETRRCREVFREFFYLMGMFLPADALPWLKWLDLGGFEKRMKKNAKDLEGIVGRWVEERMGKEYSGEDGRRDFMDVLLSVVPSAKLEYDTSTVTKATCMALISGGTDTMTVVLIWVVSLLLNNRPVLKKAQEELDIHVGRERRVDESDLKNLVYLQAIVKETLRLYPAAALGGTREFTEDCIVGGYHIPKGTSLMVNLWKLQRDPHIWDEPEEFRPERFLDRYKNVDVKGQNFELIPFGAGRRICPGVNLGLLMLHLILANLLQAFELSTVCDEKVDMSEGAGISNLKATPLNVLVAPRLSPSLYQVTPI